MAATTTGIARATIVNVVGQAVPTVAQIVLVPLYLHTIGEVRYGVVLLAISMLNYFLAFDLGLGRAVTQRIAALHDGAARNRTFWTALGVTTVTGMIGAGAMFFGGHMLLPSLLKIDNDLLLETQHALFWLALMVPLTATMSVTSGVLQGRNAFVALNVTQVVGTLCVQAAPLLVAASGRIDIPAMMAGAFVGRLVGAAISLFAAMRYLPVIGRMRLHRSELGPLLRFGRWVSVSQLMVPLLTIVDRLVIGARMGASAIAAYAIPFNFTQRFYYLPMGLNTALFPHFSKHDEAEPRTLLERAIRGLVAVQTPLLVLALIGLPPFLRLWIGPDIAARAIPVALIFVINIWFNGPVYVSFDYLVARGRPDLMTKFYLVEVIPFIALLWWLVGTLGIVGAALAFLIRSAAEACFCLIVSKTMAPYLRAMVRTVPGFALVAILALAEVPEWIRVSTSSLAFVATCLVCIRIMPAELRSRLRLPWRVKTAS